MSEMVERMVRALTGVPHGQVIDERWYRKARAALTAIREPTEAMRAAAAEQEIGWGRYDAVWQAMIDEALKE